MSTFFRNESRLLAIIALFSTASMVSAAALPPGSTLFPAPSGPDPAGGSLLIVGGGAPVAFASPTYTGNLTTTVLSGDTTNPFGLGALTFTFLLSSNASSANVIERLTSNGWTGFQTDVLFSAPSLGVAPSYADRQTSDVLGFGFLPAPLGPGTITPGSNTRLLVVHTDATAFQPSFASVIDGTVTSVPSFAPVVPEPATMTLLLAGGLMLVRRRTSR